MHYSAKKLQADANWNSLRQILSLLHYNNTDYGSVKNVLMVWVLSKRWVGPTCSWPFIVIHPCKSRKNSQYDIPSPLFLSSFVPHLFHRTCAPAHRQVFHWSPCLSHCPPSLPHSNWQSFCPRMCRLEWRDTKIVVKTIMLLSVYKHTV